MERDEILRHIKRVLSRAKRPMSVVEIETAIGDREVKPRHLNPILHERYLAAEFDKAPAIDGRGVQWDGWSLAAKTDPIELGYTYDFGAWDTDDPAGMAWMDVTIDGEAVEDVVRCRVGVDGFVEVLGVTEDGDPAPGVNGGIKTEIREGEVSVTRRIAPPSQV